MFNLSSVLLFANIFELKGLQKLFKKNFSMIFFGILLNQQTAALCCLSRGGFPRVSWMDVVSSHTLMDSNMRFAPPRTLITLCCVEYRRLSVRHVHPSCRESIQQGEFVCNLPMGQGSYTWPNGCTYDGEVYNCLRHGMGTYKSLKNSVEYTGEWSLGKRHGKVGLSSEPPAGTSAVFERFVSF